MLTSINARIIYRSLIRCTPTLTPFNTIHISLRHCQHNERLALVGRLQSPKLEGTYETGQLFVHRVFGYRGVTLFPWFTKVRDKDVSNNKQNRTVEENNAVDNHVSRELKTYSRTLYQVLIDNRDDCPDMRSQAKAIIDGNNRWHHAIPGLDYVSHEDILPYSSAEKVPIHHEKFDWFLMYDPEMDPPYRPRERLKEWQQITAHFLLMT